MMKKANPFKKNPFLVIRSTDISESSIVSEADIPSAEHALLTSRILTEKLKPTKDIGKTSGGKTKPTNSKKTPSLSRVKLSGVKMVEAVRKNYPRVDTDWIKNGDKISIKFIAAFRDDKGPRPMSFKGTVTHVDDSWINMKNKTKTNFCFKPWVYEVKKI